MRLDEGIIKQLLLISMIFLAACTYAVPEPMAINISLFEYPDCIRQCWNYLRIGETTEAELQVFIANQDYAILSTQSLPNNFSVINVSRQRSFGITFTLENELLIAIEGYRSFDVQSTTTLAEVTGLLGEPDYIYFQYFPAFEFGQISSAASYLAYFEEGLYFSFVEEPIPQTNGNQEICLNEENSVRTFDITAPISYEEALVLERPHLPAALFNLDRSDLQTWQSDPCYIIQDW